MNYKKICELMGKVGDEHGCKRADDGSVTTPPGFKDAYKQLVDAGWPALSSDPTNKRSSTRIYF